MPSRNFFFIFSDNFPIVAYGFVTGNQSAHIWADLITRNKLFMIILEKEKVPTYCLSRKIDFTLYENKESIMAELNDNKLY